jgi:hypothetical protein
MTKQRRDFETSFKLEVVRMVRDQKLSVPVDPTGRSRGSRRARDWFAVDH